MQIIVAFCSFQQYSVLQHGLSGCQRVILVGFDLKKYYYQPRDKIKGFSSFMSLSMKFPFGNKKKPRDLFQKWLNPTV